MSNPSFGFLVIACHFNTRVEVDLKIFVLPLQEPWFQLVQPLGGPRFAFHPCLTVLGPNDTIFRKKRSKWDLAFKLHNFSLAITLKHPRAS